MSKSCNDNDSHVLHPLSNNYKPRQSTIMFWNYWKSKWFQFFYLCISLIACSIAFNLEYIAPLRQSPGRCGGPIHLSTNDRLTIRSAATRPHIAQSFRYISIFWIVSLVHRHTTISVRDVVFQTFLNIPIGYQLEDLQNLTGNYVLNA